MTDPQGVEVGAAGEAPLATTSLRVRFHELDPYGHVNHGVYLNYFETARTEALEQLGFGLEALLVRGVAVIVVEATVRFHAPALAGDVLTIDSFVTEIRRASSWWHQRLLRGDELLATLDVRAATTTLDGRPTAAPADLRDALVTTIAGGPATEG